MTEDKGACPDGHRAYPFCTLAFNMTSKQLALGGATNDPSELRRFCERLLLLADTMERLPGYAVAQGMAAPSGGETGTGSTEGSSPVGQQADAPNLDPDTPQTSGGHNG